MNVITFNKVIEEVALYYGVKEEEILDGDKQNHLVIPRQMAAYLSTELTMLGRPALASEFGKSQQLINYSYRKMKRTKDRFLCAAKKDLFRVLTEYRDSEYIRFEGKPTVNSNFNPLDINNEETY